MAVLVLTEDGAAAKDPRPVWETVVRRLLQQVDPGTQTDRVVLEIPRETLVAPMIANRGWRNRPSATTARFVQEIAAALLAEKFVFVHLDGDSAWSDVAARARAPREFDEQIRDAVQKRLRDIVRERARVTPGEPTRRRGRPMAPEPSTAAVDAAVAPTLARLRRLIPHYCVEAWLYQSVDEGLSQCRSRHKGQHAEQWASWRADRGALDEIAKLPDVTNCAKKALNPELARALTTDVVRDVIALEKSLHATVEHLKESPTLRAALAATYTDPPTA